ncbi:hypothetical protein SPRG_12164 [Saprolegnia parasitica CBS 223.65]|uniref:Uncharacterized protein n=1 Tax=Saprolegnia parasitica (strain CBS 223.65) TaxID=695850 RepID=A0A067C7H2_SAPPC|nr:hypothetical protein SPRG_12164 [Saprolegnia parasitica CBS 223.65]KDO22737.1 hypothetical protein SPRG_12164 [Saprolegnia parasitica CBS 223.65]|eukprot:XP_012206525.1 hypothetical protein SPRG_12164 [Saprolegnia parasitica CBS 223.65]
MNDQPDLSGLLLRLYQQSQGIHKSSKKASDELQSHLATTALPVECHEKLFHQILHHATLSGDAHAGPTRWLTLVAASNLLCTAGMLAMYPMPVQQKILLRVLPDALERWFKLTATNDRQASGNGQLRDGVFVPSTILQHERLAQQSGQAFALAMFLDAIVSLLEGSDDEAAVVELSRVLQTTAIAHPSALQKGFVRAANVLLGWSTRVETAPLHRCVSVVVVFGSRPTTINSV